LNPYIIAEIGQAHDGSLGLAHSFIEALKDSGINAIKFQTHISEAESSIYEKFRIKFSYEDSSRFDYWKRMEFDVDSWKGLKQHCDKYNLDFISTPSCLKAVDLLEEVGVSAYKIGSGDYDNALLLQKILLTSKPIILSTGLSFLNEVDDLVELTNKHGSKLTLLQCTTAYPTSPKQWGLNVINDLIKRYKGVKIGFSDHSGDIHACLAAAAHGAEVFEFHVAFHKSQFGPDTTSSIMIDDVKYLVDGILDIHKSELNPINKTKVNKSSIALRKVFGKSIAINKDLNRGHIITFDDLESKKPAGYGINVKDFKKIIGKTINKDLKKWTFLNYDCFE
jgi:N,N'-diacetyllegionaminate synthase